MTYEILPPQLAIKSMRDSGYKDAAHAIAELVDNSIQAGLEVNDCTEVEVLCLDKINLVGERNNQHIHEIAVYDNACGMSADVLRIALQFGNGTHLASKQQEGIGKFGMGLPNASISQCQKVDVWSWQNSTCLHTYIDIEEVRKGTLRDVPEPQPSEIPKKWLALIRDTIGEHGTLVVWSELDRVRWKRSKAFLNNAEFLIGRIYRYFLNEGKARIRLVAFEDSTGIPQSTVDRDAIPNDPLYLMRSAQCPEPVAEKPAFDLAAEYQIAVGYNGVNHEVNLRFSVAKTGTRRAGGGSTFGKHAAKNVGVSIVRASRELEMNNTFEIKYDPRERWWGAEIHFGPELDDVFGVTNNKQAATAFKDCDLDEDAVLEGLTPGSYRDLLVESNDPRLAMYIISHEIKNRLRILREQIKRMAAPKGEGDGYTPAPGSAEDIATRATKKRKEELGKIGKSDEGESLSTDEREKELESELVAEGVELNDAKAIAVDVVHKNLKFLFQEASVPGTAIFDLRSKGGTILVLINTRHPACEGLFELLNDTSENSAAALKALKLLLTAWARLEDEAGDTRRQTLEDIRMDWGRIARDFLKEAEE